MSVFNRINLIEYLFTFYNIFIRVCIRININTTTNDNNNKNKRNNQKYVS